MDYRQIVSVTGLGGLYILVGSKKDGAIVRSLTDNSTRFVASRVHHVMPLESIEIYTTGDNVRLQQVLRIIAQSDKPRPDPKQASNDTIKEYFLEVFPDIDQDRVYVSDMKKILKWYDLLLQHDLLQLDDEPTEESASVEAADTIGEDPSDNPRSAETPIEATPNEEPNNPDPADTTDEASDKPE